MRAITQAAAGALLEHRPFKRDNTEVMTSSEGARLHLYGTAIVQVPLDPPHGAGYVAFSCQCWNTQLTRERINGVFEVAGVPMRLFSKRGCLTIALPDGSHRDLNSSLTYYVSPDSHRFGEALAELSPLHAMVHGS